MGVKLGRMGRLRHPLKVADNLSFLFLISLLLWVSTAQDWDRSCRVQTACPKQPPQLLEVYDRLGVNVGEYCIFKRVIDTKKCLYSINSSLTVAEKASVPDSISWSRCVHCGYDSSTQKFEAWSHNSSGEGYINLARGSWGEFFHNSRNDRLTVRHSQTPPTEWLDGDVLLVSRPVFLMPTITLHPGHVFVDLLEQIHNAMQRAYGRLRRDSLLVLDVSNPEEQSVLIEKVTQLTGLYVQKEIGSGSSQLLDTYGSTLSALTALPVLTRQVLDLAGPRVLFTDIHVGMESAHAHKDIAMAFNGMHSLAKATSYESQSATNLRELSGTVKERLQTHTLQKPSDEGSTGLVVVIQRGKQPKATAEGSYGMEKQNRAFTNLAEVVGATKWALCVPEEKLQKPRGVHCNRRMKRSWSVQIVCLEDSSGVHAEQRKLFSEADVILTAAGTAAHNALFLDSRAAVLVAMQPSWCKYGWMYSTQPHLLGISAETVCATDDDQATIPLHQLSRNFWLQPPRFPKDQDFSVNIPGYLAALLKVAGMSEGGVDALVHQWQEMDTTKTTKADSLPTIKSTSAALATPLISGVSSTQHTDGTWTIKLRCEVSVSNDGDAIGALAALPLLSICTKNALGSSAKTWCTPLEVLNYYSELELNAIEPSVALMIWLQAYPSGGTLVNTHVPVLLDVRLPNSGLLPPAALPAPFGPGAPPMSVVTANGSRILLPVQSGLQIQHDYAAICRLHEMSMHACLAGAVTLYTHLQTTLLRPQMRRMLAGSAPTPVEPFVFLHLEKTAGTTFRAFLVKQAQRLGVQFFVPCHGNASLPGHYVHCTVLSPNDVRRYGNGSDAILTNTSVLGGHFAWGSWKHLPSYKDSKPPPCLVFGRHPVDRTISYYYQRCYNNTACSGYKTRMNDLSIEQMSVFIRSSRHALPDPVNASRVVLLDEGVSDAICRTLAGRRDTAGVFVDSSSPPLPVPDSPGSDTLEVSLQNLEYCVVGMQESYEESVAHATHFFPWLRPGATGQNSTKSEKLMKLYDNMETRHTLRPDLVRAVEESNACDLRVYHRMLDLFHLQRLILEREIAKNN